MLINAMFTSVLPSTHPRRCVDRMCRPLARCCKWNQELRSHVYTDVGGMRKGASVWTCLPTTPLLLTWHTAFPSQTCRQWRFARVRDFPHGRPNARGACCLAHCKPVGQRDHKRPSARLLRWRTSRRLRHLWLPTFCG
jgi:hypothetical protein